MRITEVDQKVTQIQLDTLEKALDKVFSRVGIDVEFTRHFLDRVNDERNVRQITLSELGQLFKKEFIKYGKPIAQLGPDAEAVMKDMSSDINIPFALDWNRDSGMLELVAKTVMRKKNFSTPNKEFPVESRLDENPIIAAVAKILAKKGMKVARNTIRQAMQHLPTGSGPDVLVDLITKGAAVGTGIGAMGRTDESIIMESGSAPGVGPIHRDEIEATLSPLSKELGVDLVKQALGSVGKKQFSGDIDVAIKLETPEDEKAFTEKLQSHPLILYYAKTSVYITKIKIQNYDPNREAFDPRTKESLGIPQGRTGFVQLDFMPGDPDWLKTYYHSPHEEDSNYKGVYRNIMLASIAANFDREDNPERLPDGRPIESKRYMWSSNGLSRISRTPKPKANGEGYTKANINKIIAGPWYSGDEIAQQLNLGSSKDLNSFETLLTAIKNNYSEDLVKRIIDDFSNNNQIKQMGLPNEIK